MILDDIRKTLAQTLEFSTLNTCSRWSEKVRIMQTGPWRFDLHPWLKQPHDDLTPEIAVKKAAQMGFTEWALNKCLYVLDQKRHNVLYILPSLRPDAVNFSKGRINGAATLSPYIENLFGESKSETQKITNAHANLYLRGANSPIKSLDVNLVILDEAAEITATAIELARYRLVGQPEGQRQLIALSTPTIDGQGIDRIFEDTDQCIYMFPCPHCNRLVEFRFPESIVITADSYTDPKINNSHFICHRCKGTLPQESKQYLYKEALWQPTKKNMINRGYYINGLYSCMRSAPNIAIEALRAEDDPVVKSEFYNSTLGLCYTPENARITDVNINDATGDFMNNNLGGRSNKLVTMGMDVGQKKHHVAIIAWDFQRGGGDILSAAKGHLLYYGTIESFEEASDLMKRWEPRMTIVDSQPDLKGAAALADRYEEVCYYCYYSQNKNSSKIVINEKDNKVSVNRTFWMDQLLGKIQGRTLVLPRDISMEFRNHLKAPVKVYKTDDRGIAFCEFTKRERDHDHFYHALTYAMIALGNTAGGK